MDVRLDRRLDLRKLTYFIEVSEAGSFTRAARAVGVSQATLSHQVAALEKELRAQLFYRTGRGVRPTDAGYAFLGRARTIVDELKMAEGELEGYRDAPSGRLRFGVPPSVSHSLISGFALEMRRAFPNVTLAITEGSSGFIGEWLTRDRLDLGIQYKLGRALVSTEDVLLTEDLLLVGTSDDPIIIREVISFDDVVRLPLILPSRPHGLRALLEQIAARRGKTLAPVMELDGAAMVPSLVSSGCGYSVLPNISLRLDMEHRSLGCCRIVDPALQRTMMISAPHQSRSRRMTRAAVELLKEQVRVLDLS